MTSLFNELDEDLFYGNRIIHKSKLDDYFESYYKRLIFFHGMKEFAAREKVQTLKFILKRNINQMVQNRIDQKKNKFLKEGRKNLLRWASERFEIGLSELEEDLGKGIVYSEIYRDRNEGIRNINYEWNYKNESIEISSEIIKLPMSNPSQLKSKNDDEEYKKKKLRYQEDFEFIQDLSKKMKPAPILDPIDSSSQKQSNLFSSIMGKNYPNHPIIHIEYSRVFRSKMFQIISKIDGKGEKLPPWRSIVIWCASAGILRRKEYDEFKEIF